MIKSQELLQYINTKKNEKEFENMNARDMIQYVKKNRKYVLKSNDYEKLNISTSYIILDLHNFHELAMFAGMSNGATLSDNDYLKLTEYIDKMKMSYEILFDIYNTFSRIQKLEKFGTTNLTEFTFYFLEYTNILKQVHAFVESTRKCTEKVDFADKVVLKKTNFPEFLTVLIKLYQEKYIIGHYMQHIGVNSIAEFSIFLAELYQDVYYYNYPLLNNEKVALETVLRASQNFHFKSYTKKALSHRFFHFLVSLPELKNCPHVESLLP